MKQLLFLLSLFCLTIAIEYSLARNAKQYALNNQTTNVELFTDETQEAVDNDASMSLLPDKLQQSYCAYCCQYGTSTDKNCCKNCNNCQLYSDGGKSECFDFPH